MHRYGQARRRMRILPRKRPYNTVAYHAAVFVVCLRQQENKLRYTAPRDDITAPQIIADEYLEIVNNAVEAALRKLGAVFSRYRYKCKMSGITASGNGARK